ncbi:hypothetical protein APSETT444_003369 [Aspergillus pseudonomiae]
MSLAQVLSVLASRDDEGNSLARRLAYTNGGPTLDIDPLPSAQRKGLIAVTVMAFLSFIATLILLLFITYRLVFWRSNYARYIGYNQYICWISEEYEPIRLWTHYIWIFLAEFGTVCLYAIMWFQLRRRIKQSAILGSSHTESLKRLRRVIGYMIIYPVAYIVLSLPLAAGRMATAQGQTPSIAFFCVAGAVITSSGLVDVLLYTLTRRNLILESEPSRDRSYNRFASSKNRKTDHLTTITAAEGKHTRTDISVLRTHRHREDDDEFGHTVREGSTDNIVQPSGMELAPLGKVYQHTTIEITHEPAYPEAESSDRSSKGSLGNGKGPEQSARIASPYNQTYISWNYYTLIQTQWLPKQISNQREHGAPVRVSMTE